MVGPGAEDLRESLRLISEWTPKSDVIALQHYGLATSLFSSGAAAYLNAHYRKVVKLRNQAFVTTFIPVVVLPSLVGTIMHHRFVVIPMLQGSKCPVCLELRGGVVQAFAGVLYPLVLAPLAAFQFASRLYTYYLPSIKEPKMLMLEFIKMTRPILPKLYILAAVQAVAGIAWTHWEAHNLFTVMEKLVKMEEAVKRHNEAYFPNT